MTEIDVDHDWNERGPEHRRGKKTVSNPSQYVFDTSTKNADQLSDPVKCGLCSRVLSCPRNKDYDEFLERKNLKCLTSEDQICSNAVKNPSNKTYVDRLRSIKKT